MKSSWLDANRKNCNVSMRKLQWEYEHNLQVLFLQKLFYKTKLKYLGNFWHIKVSNHKNKKEMSLADSTNMG